MTNPLAMPPPSPPPPFPPPVLLKARRVTGFVQAPNSASGPTAANPLELSWNVSGSLSDSDPGGPPTLSRRNSMFGNILIITNEDGNEQAYWLQRKLAKTSHGTVRVGFVLRPGDEDGGVTWEVVESDGVYPFEMVAIKIQDKSAVLTEENVNRIKDPKVELSALELLARLDPQNKGNVVTARHIAACDSQIYLIMPYFHEGTLFGFCAEQGKLEEGMARHFFRQILKGLETLQKADICHRNLGLDSVLISGTNSCLSGFGHSLRIPKSQETGTIHLLQPQPVTGSNPQFIAPEVLQNEPFDGYAIDLWAAGLLLFSMLHGSDALFVAPLPHDRKFRDICLKHELRLAAKSWGGEGRSEESMDLLQKMLRADPKERLGLSDVKTHPWVMGNGENDVVLPSFAPLK